jgi:CRISPR-associated exonuclease Cas4
VELIDWYEADVVMISALEHYSYCPRQCALIHMEQTFNENIYTMRGRRVHETVDRALPEIREGVKIERGLPLWSGRLGLVGRADVVEFHGEIPYPVEYKVGPRRPWKHAEIQVCAQALCLEEMMGCPVPRGAVYHHGSRRRKELVFDEGLREQVEEMVEAVRRTTKASPLPLVLNDRRCDNCSLIDSCLPSVIAEKRKLRTHLKELFTVDEKDAEKAP